MSLFTKFFKESDTQLGVFYPNHYLIAVFRIWRQRNRLSRNCDSQGSPRMR